jgi:hypothetical protein
MTSSTSGRPVVPIHNRVRPGYLPCSTTAVILIEDDRRTATVSGGGR